MVRDKIVAPVLLLELMTLLCTEEELANTGLGNELELDTVAAFDNELTEELDATEVLEALETAVGVEDVDPVVVILSILNQLTLKPPAIALISNVWLPAVKTTVRSTVTQFCHPPVTGTVTVS